MAGELWRSYFQIGKETTPGTSVAATRRMYFEVDSSNFTREREPRAYRFATSSRDNVRAMTLGPTVVTGKVKMPLSASEVVELLLMGIKGGVEPTGAGTPKLWTFTPGVTLDAATIEWFDGARGWDVGGCYVDKIKFSGSADGEATVEADIFGLNMAIATPTGSLTERVPDVIEGWETKLYVDAFGGTAGTTQKAGTLINWEVEIGNGLERKYFAANTLNAGAVVIDQLEINAKLTYEAASSEAATEYGNWDAVTRRLVRLMFGDNEVIADTDTKFVTIDLPGAWSAVNLSGTDKKTRVYELSLQYIYDATNTFGVQIRAQNARSAAY